MWIYQKIKIWLNPKFHFVFILRLWVVRLNLKPCYWLAKRNVLFTKPYFTHFCSIMHKCLAYWYPVLATARISIPQSCNSNDVLYVRDYNSWRSKISSTLFSFISGMLYLCISTSIFSVIYGMYQLLSATNLGHRPIEQHHTIHYFWIPTLPILHYLHSQSTIIHTIVTGIYWSSGQNLHCGKFFNAVKKTCRAAALTSSWILLN